MIAACQTVSLARAMPVRQTVASRVAGIRMPGSLMVRVDGDDPISVLKFDRLHLAP